MINEARVSGEVENPVPTLKSKKKPSENGQTHRVELGQFIVADPEICHGKPTFKGTRIMVWQVLDDVAEGLSWEYICKKRWGGRIPLAAVMEAVKLARAAWLDESGSLCGGKSSRRLSRVAV